MAKRLNINSGDKFGRLKIIKEVKQINRARAFLCKCDCGKETIVKLIQLTSGETKSCGCYKLDLFSNLIYRHGFSRTKIYHIWTSMKQRCFNEKAKVYSYYGERGITMCEEWKDFETFKEWAVNNGFKNGLSIERKNVNGNYEPSNCSWIPRNKQAENTRNARIINYNGEELHLNRWAIKLNINYNTLTKRLRSGWSIVRAFDETPVQTQFSRYKKHEA